MTDNRGPDQPTQNAEARIRSAIANAPLQADNYRVFAEANGKHGTEAEVRAFTLAAFDKKQAEERA